jgi:hypothetical protein
MGFVACLLLRALVRVVCFCVRMGAVAGMGFMITHIDPSM